MLTMPGQHSALLSDGDKTKKPSRNGVMACFDSWITAAY
jgi:hypothetical protein